MSKRNGYSKQVLSQYSHWHLFLLKMTEKPKKESLISQYIYVHIHIHKIFI